MLYSGSSEMAAGCCSCRSSQLHASNHAAVPCSMLQPQLLLRLLCCHDVQLLNVICLVVDMQFTSARLQQCAISPFDVLHQNQIMDCTASSTVRSAGRSGRTRLVPAGSRCCQQPCAMYGCSLDQWNGMSAVV